MQCYPMVTLKTKSCPYSHAYQPDNILDKKYGQATQFYLPWISWLPNHKKEWLQDEHFRWNSNGSHLGCTLHHIYNHLECNGCIIPTGDCLDSTAKCWGWPWANMIHLSPWDISFRNNSKFRVWELSHMMYLLIALLAVFAYLWSFAPEHVGQYES